MTREQREKIARAGGKATWESVRKDSMLLSNFLVIAVSLLAIWALGFFVFHIGGSLIHILLVVAVVSFALHFVLGRA